MPASMPTRGRLRALPRLPFRARLLGRRCIGNVSYWVLIKSTLGAVFPVFGDGNTLSRSRSSSVGIWLFHFLVLRGVKEAPASTRSSRSPRSSRY